MKIQALAKAREARWTPPSNTTILPPSTPSPELVLTVVTPECEVEAEKLTGATYERFMEERLDFRCWGTLTHKGFRDSGHLDDLMSLFYDYHACSDRNTGHQMIVSLDELPLSVTSSETLTRMEIAVNYMLTHDKYNALHGTSHRCMFLPKFHPELNPIERVWSMMKRHCRKFSNGSMSTLTESMNYGLSTENVSVATVRRICRYTTCYLYAYTQGMDIIQAEQWMKKRRSHRGYSTKMDSELAAIY